MTQRFIMTGGFFEDIDHDGVHKDARALAYKTAKETGRPALCFHISSADATQPKQVYYFTLSQEVLYTALRDRPLDWAPSREELMHGNVSECSLDFALSFLNSDWKTGDDIVASVDPTLRCMWDDWALQIARALPLSDFHQINLTIVDRDDKTTTVRLNGYEGSDYERSGNA